MTPTFLLLAQFLVILGLPWLLGRGLRLERVVPMAVLQILLGIALGPSLLGRLAPGVSAALFDPAGLRPLAGLAAIAVLFFGFVSGMHLDTGLLRRGGLPPRALGLISLGSVAGPAVLGIGLSLAMGGGAVTACALGIAASVTALPVLAAILREAGWLGSRLGQAALAVAAVNDAALWVGLALLLSVGHAGGADHGSAYLAWAPPFLVVLVAGVRPLLRRAAPRLDGDAALAVAALVAVAAAAGTEAMGLQYILGAFLAGTVIPQSLRDRVLPRIEGMTIVLLMPFFFMLTGLRTNVDPASSAFLHTFLLATAVAVAGKVGAVALTARLAGEGWRFGLALGSLLQAKGLMEVIVVTALRDAGLIDADTYSALILMAVACTAIAAPLARLSRGVPASAGRGAGMAPGAAQEA